MHTAVKTIISIVVVLIVLVAAGIGYTYYLGPDASQTTPAAAPPAIVPNSIPKPTQAAANAKIGVSIQTLTSPVKLGANASVAIKTLPAAKCTISVTYNNVASKDSGLAPKNADEYGVASWTWTVDAAAAVGKWPVKVNCVLNERSAVVQGDLVVEQ